MYAVTLQRTLLKAFGAEVVLTDPSKQIVGAMERAKELQKLIPNSVVLDQVSAPASPPDKPPCSSRTRPTPRCTT